MTYIQLFEHFINEKLSILYHGSPHQFDAFSTDAMGSGEGNQYFGWGLYFTDVKDVALDYAHGLYKNKELVDGVQSFKQIQKDYQLPNLSWERFKYIRKLLDKPQHKKAEWFTQKAIDELVSMLPNSSKWVEDADGNPIKERELSVQIAQSIVSDISFQHQPTLYTISLHVDKLRWLEWYDPMPLKDAQRVLTTAQHLPLIIVPNHYVDGHLIQGVFPAGNKVELDSGSAFYEFLQTYMTQQEASILLLKAGFTGIKYPVNTVAKNMKQRIYTNAAEHYNYVIFDHTIIRKTTRKPV